MSEPAEAIPNQYIVVFKQHTPEDVCQQHCEWAQSAHSEAAALRAESERLELTGVGERFSLEAFTGYVGRFDGSLKNEIESREEVAFVEPDYKVYASTTVTQKPVPSWGLARISSNHLLRYPLPSSVGYTYEATAGAGTRAYVLDTGILTTHEDFGGRAKWGTNTVSGSSNTDKNGHGTHVAGTIGGTKYGVAKKCALVAVKVLGDNGSGSNSGIILGLQWAVNDARNSGQIKKSVANMSLGGAKSDALNKAVAAAVNAGLTVVVAAGNSAKDAINYSPASEPLAFTVGSSAISDLGAPDSNWGKSLDVFAPGVDITSDWCSPGNNGTKTISGTSMASPHVVGLALTLIAKDPARYNSPSTIAKGITDLAAKNSGRLIPVRPGTTTLLAYNGN